MLQKAIIFEWEPGHERSAQKTRPAVQIALPIGILEPGEHLVLEVLVVKKMLCIVHDKFQSKKSQ